MHPDAGGFFDQNPMEMTEMVVGLVELHNQGARGVIKVAESIPIVELAIPTTIRPHILTRHVYRRTYCSLFCLLSVGLN